MRDAPGEETSRGATRVEGRGGVDPGEVRGAVMALSAVRWPGAVASDGQLVTRTLSPAMLPTLAPMTTGRSPGARPPGTQKETVRPGRDRYSARRRVSHIGPLPGQQG
ncbi:hypothetical protein ACIRPP_30960 [Streptomyces sp. NPDC101219]|uniref:hypothetical protein n=1 Tax=Streptomyces sp. NPDC101219 TaxID=3366131 RepID=UPI00381A560D